MDGSPVVIRLPLGRANAYLVIDERPILVDTGFPGDYPLLRARLREHRISPSDLSLVVVTHAHFDHTGNLPSLKREADVSIACHLNAARNLRDGTNAVIRPGTPFGRVVRPLVSRAPKLQRLEPEIVIERETSLRPFGVHGSLVPTPGHTDGCLSLLLDDGSALVGDLVMNGLFRRKTPHSPLFVHDRTAWEESLRALLDRGVERFYPGHGGPFDREEIKALLRPF